MKLNRGDIVIANLESVSKGSIQKYTRPYIIISNNKANQYSPVVTAVAMSTKTWKKKYLPTHCLIPAAKVKVSVSKALYRKEVILGNLAKGSPIFLKK